jgi:hypothetical protein
VRSDSFFDNEQALKEFYKKLQDAEIEDIVNTTRAESMDSKSSTGSFSEFSTGLQKSNSVTSLNLNHQDSNSVDDPSRGPSFRNTNERKSIFEPITRATVRVGKATADLATKVASITPGLENLVNYKVHTGFYGAYEAARGFVHAVVRRELAKDPTRVYFTGHSLGGVLASYAALDVAIHTIPRVHSHLSRVNEDNLANGLQNFVDPNVCNVSLYTFGSPRPGNVAYSDFHGEIVTDSFRVVCDGDIVTSLPPGKFGYKHLKTEVLIDKFFSGSLIVDPSFVEKRFRTETKSSVSSHSLIVYSKALVGVKQATEYMNENVHEYATENGYIDTIKLALDTEKKLSKLRESGDIESAQDADVKSKDKGIVTIDPMESYIKQLSSEGDKPDEEDTESPFVQNKTSNNTTRTSYNEGTFSEPSKHELEVQSLEMRFEDEFRDSLQVSKSKFRFGL